MLRKKVAVVITNRSSYNKVKTIIKNLPNTIEPVLILGNSIYLYRYGYAYQNIVNDFPDIKVLKTSLAVEGDKKIKMSQTVGLGLIELSTLIENEKPDLVVTVADRYETMATAIAAAYVNVPLVHLQGGEISGTIDDKVRNSITQLADYHFTATDESADRVLRMKMKDHARIWNMGCPSMDLIEEGLYAVSNEVFCELNSHGHGDEINIDESFIIVMLHPDTTGSAINVEVVMDVLNEFPEQKVIGWPNVDAGSDKIAKAWRMRQEGYWNSPVRYMRHIDPVMFGNLLKRTDCIIGNSSTGIREATYVGTPSITLGDRQQNRECGINVQRAPFDKEKIRNALKYQLGVSYTKNTMYGDGHAGEKIAKQLGKILGQA